MKPGDLVQHMGGEWGKVVGVYDACVIYRALRPRLPPARAHTLCVCWAIVARVDMSKRPVSISTP
jgi:hypothetical protein